MLGQRRWDPDGLKKRAPRVNRQIKQYYAYRPAYYAYRDRSGRHGILDFRFHRAFADLGE